LPDWPTVSDHVCKLADTAEEELTYKVTKRIEK
jgi:hypothetical protein